MLTDLGFMPYIAAQVHSTKALRENILEQLRDGSKRESCWATSRAKQ
jgi:hypothetical protein